MSGIVFQVEGAPVPSPEVENVERGWSNSKEARGGNTQA